MKNRFLLLITLVASAFSLQAQTSYTAAVGLGLDLGDGFTFVGPSGKYFFADNHAGQFDLGFEDRVTALTFLYSYHGQFSGVDGLQWFAGIGPSIWLIDDADTGFLLRPHTGLDFKIPDVPLAFSASWRPGIGLSDNFDGDRFEAGIFALGFRYAFD
ncbi:hypothetical protein HME9304_02671 [Flagellimonas maritima]|uniref:Outer membrane insertion C-signal n=2 Tax=Flagellimonas maritima TaxID=1383885 RepID=A0A2Z4LVV7_9FLAO|nr:hypothetical protein HME9304_02671 [Allomuricauda aurantiaca]